MLLDIFTAMWSYLYPNVIQIKMELKSLIRIWREIQDISQADVAKATGISQPAIARFENGKGSISPDTLRTMAPILNLNPLFMEKLIGYPFKQSYPEKPIKIFLPEGEEGRLERNILKLILESTDYSEALLLTPEDLPKEKSVKLTRLMRKGYTVCALVIRDLDGNLFVIRKKDKDSLLHDPRLRRRLRGHSDTLLIRRRNISLELYRDIQEWISIDTSKIEPLFDLSHFLILQRLIRTLNSNRVCALPDLEDTNLRKRLEELSSEPVDTQAASILKGICEDIRKHFTIVQE